MKQYGYWKALVMSFYSRDLYRDVGKNWGGEVAIYLILLLALCWIPMMAFMQIGVNVAYPRIAEMFVPQVPIITVKNGIAQTPENRPYFIKDPDSKKVIGVIDTSGKYTTIEKQPFAILITKTAVMSKDDKTNEIKIHSFPDTLNYVFDPVIIKNKVGKWLHWLWLVIWPLAIFFSFVYRFFQSVIYAIFGKIYSSIVDISLPYSQILMLTMVAITPAIVLNTIFMLFGISFSGKILVLFGVAMAYLIFAINANKPVKDLMVVKE